ncbi:MAG: hypothetical protein ACKO96_00810 [Flammeovirgaceae bacterium]
MQEYIENENKFRKINKRIATNDAAAAELLKGLKPDTKKSEDTPQTE